MALRANLIFTLSLLLLLWATSTMAQQVLGGVNLNGTPPAQSIGNESSWYIDFATGNAWGPKSSGQWPPTALPVILNPSSGVTTVNGELLISNPAVTSPTALPGLRSNYTSIAVYGAAQAGSFHQFSCVMGGQGATTPGIGTTCLNVSIRPDQTLPYSNYGRAGEWELYALTGAITISAGFPLSGNSDLSALNGGITVNDTTMANGTTGSHIYPVFATANIGVTGQAPVVHAVHVEQGIKTGGVVSYLNGVSVLENGQSPVVGLIVQSGAILTGRTYNIISIGTTDFTTIGAASNTVGLEFVATGFVSGTGRAVSTGIGSHTMNVGAGLFQTGTQYIITAIGSTDFTAIGAASNDVGVIFTPSGAGNGTGTAVPYAVSAAFTVSCSSISSNACYNNVLMLQDRIPHIGGPINQPTTLGGSLISYDNKTPCSPDCPMTLNSIIDLGNVTVAGNIISSPNVTLTGAGNLILSLVQTTTLTATNGSAQTFILLGATPTVPAGQLAFGKTFSGVIANCGSLAGSTGCVQVGVNGGLKYYPVF